VDRKAECDNIFNDDMVTWGDDHKVIGKFEVLKSSMVGSTYYAAVKRTKFATETAPELSNVFAVICLTSTNMKDYYNFAYKDMDENVGPYQCDCPKGILDLLTPTENEYALGWRKQCYENLAAKKNPNAFNKLPVDTIIKVVMPFDTKYFKKDQEVRLRKRTKWGSNRTEWITMNGVACRFTAGLMKQLQDCYEVVGNA
jgi:hypothetical protein